jgi:uncharacterized membrane protein YfcA
LPARSRAGEGGELDLSAGEIAALCAASLLAGTVDAIGGGGGLITVPALLAVGLPPHMALATNKGQSVFGSFSALIRYAHAGLVDRAAARVAFPLALGASALGAVLAMSLRASILGPMILVLLVAAALAVTFARPAEVSPESVGSSRRIVLVMALGAVVLGAYDGFFGPGAGTLWIALYVGLARLPLARATADTKVVNFASNAAALAIFAHGGLVFWKAALPMAVSQIFGGFLGAHLAVRRGDRFIRAVVLLVAGALVLKVAHDLYLR